MGPDVQLTVTTTSIQGYLEKPETVYTVNFATANNSDPNQLWVLHPATDSQQLFFILSNAPPKGYLLDVSPWFGPDEFDAGELWIFGPRGTITDTAFTNNTPVSNPFITFHPWHEFYGVDIAVRPLRLSPPPQQQQAHHPLHIHTAHFISRSVLQ
jgi:hypothetical protein